MKSSDDELKLEEPIASLETLERSILHRICSFLIPRCVLSRVSSILHEASSCGEIWKDRSIARWSELKHAKEVSDNEWKSLYGRKHKEGTNIQDFAKIYRGCDFYQCPNGHTFLIGECRLPMQIGRCPECNEKIGGRHHAMLNSNQRRGDVMRNVLGSENVSLDNLHSMLENKAVNKRPSHMRVIEEQDDGESEPVPPSWLTCPLTRELYKDPCSTPNGQVFERKIIEKYVRRTQRCPITNVSLALGDLKPVPETKRDCARWRARHLRPGKGITNESSGDSTEEKSV